MTEEEIKRIYSDDEGRITSMEKKDLVDDISIKSRLKYVKDFQASKVAKFLLDYCFKDSQEVYTNGTVLVPMFRVLDALAMIDQKSIDYREG